MHVHSAGVWLLIPQGSFENPNTVSQGPTGKQCSGSHFSSWLHDFDKFFQLFGNDSFLYLYKQLVHLKHLNLALRVIPEKQDQ